MSYKGRDHYYYKDGESREEFKVFENYPNPPKWGPVADPSSGKCCFSDIPEYGMNYLRNSPNFYEKFQRGKDFSGCYSNPKNYGEDFRRNYEQNWRCATPRGCKKQITRAAEGVI
jgi:hypothetical protein